jgi:hypothetical protein
MPRTSLAPLPLALSTLLCALCPALALAQQPPARPAQSEQLAYSVTFGAARVAAVQLHTGCPAKDHRAAALVASSSGLADVVSTFLIRFDSFLALDAPLPREARSKITEDGQTRAYRTTFDPALTPRVRSKVRGKDYDWRLPTLPSRPHDMLSWVFALRADPDLSPGQRRRMLVWDGWKLFWLDARVDKLAALITPAGRTQAIPIALTRHRIHHDGDALFKPSRDPELLGTLWLSNSPSRTPVGIDFASPIGMVAVRIERAITEPCP